MQWVATVLITIGLWLISIGDAVLFTLHLIKSIARVAVCCVILVLAQIRKVKRKPKTVEIFNAHYMRQKMPVVKKKARAAPVKKGKVRRVIVHRFPLFAKLRYFLIGMFFSFLFLFTPLLVLVFLQDLPNPKIIADGQIPQTTKIYDRNRTLLYQIYATHNRTLVPLNSVPKHLQLATIAIEDQKFYEHPGFDVVAIVRSLWQNLSGNGLQGGSTITQQLVKSSLLNPETSLRRKVKEVILAFWAERIYTKDQILAMYFNHIPYGGTAWGVETAAEVYFGKRVSELTLAESSFLAGIPKAPTLYSPFGTTPTLWQKRQREVLTRMVELGFITKEEEEQALAEELTFRPSQTPINAPHFVMYVRDWLVRSYGLSFVEKGGLSVITSLDLTTQGMAEKIVREEVAKSAHLNISNAAALITNPKNGDILAMVGNKDFNDAIGGNVNVTTARRQPGSAIKIVTYSAALANGYTAATMLQDSPVSYPTLTGAYAPVNYDGKFHGSLPLRFALGNSLNVPAVKTLASIGIPTFVNYGKRMGIRSFGEPNKYGLSITLGAAEVTMLDLATAYSVVANAGLRIDPNPILSVVDYKGTTYEKKDTLVGEPILDEGIAFILSDILADNKARVIEFGENSPLQIPGRRVSVKTGTSDNKRDNWTIGFTPNLLVAAWVGNLDGSPMNQALASGISGAAPIWNKIMTTLLPTLPNQSVRIPVNVIAKPCLGRIEYFLRGTENSVNCALPVVLPTPTPTPNSE